MALDEGWIDVVASARSKGMLHGAGRTDLDGRVARRGGDIDGAIEGVSDGRSGYLCGEGASLGSGC